MNCQKLRLFADKKSIFLESLENLVAQHADRVQLVKENILELKSIIVSDMLNDSSRESACLNGLPCQAQWADPPTVTLFAVLNRTTERGFLRSLVYMVPPRVGLFSLGRVELLLFMTPEEYKVITEADTNSGAQRNGLRPYNIFYNLIFESELITTVSADNFFIQRSKSQKYHDLHLVRLRPRVDISDVILSAGQFEEFTFFVTQGLIRGVTLAKSMDMWIPFAYRKVFVEMAKPTSPLRGAYFCDKLSRLSPKQMEELFRIFRTHEMFQYSSFRAALEKQRYEPPGLTQPMTQSRQL